MKHHYKTPTLLSEQYTQSNLQLLLNNKLEQQNPNLETLDRFLRENPKPKL